jgi:preprotein translocase subunit SecE
MAKAKENAVKRTTDPVKKADKSAKKNSKERFVQWFRDLKSELKKVVWPTKKQLINNTVVAVVVIVLAALVLWGFDSLAQTGAKALIDLV